MFFGRGCQQKPKQKPKQKMIIIYEKNDMRKKIWGSFLQGPKKDFEKLNKKWGIKVTNKTKQFWG